MNKYALVLEEKYSFPQNGGYFITFKYKPKNIIAKLLIGIGLIRITDPVAEIGDKYDNKYIPIVKSTLFTKTGILCTSKNIKTIRVLIEERIVKITNLDIKIDKIYS